MTAAPTHSRFVNVLREEMQAAASNMCAIANKLSEHVMSVVLPTFEVLNNIRASESCLFYTGKCFEYGVGFYEAVKGRVFPLQNLANYFANSTALIDSLLIISAINGFINPGDGALEDWGVAKNIFLLFAGSLSLCLFLESIGVVAAGVLVASFGGASFVATVICGLAFCGFLIKTGLALQKIEEERRQRTENGENPVPQTWMQSLTDRNNVELMSGFSNMLRLGLITCGVTQGIPFILLALTASGFGLVNAYQNR